MLTDFTLQTELFAVGRQQQLNCCGVKANTVVQRLHLVFRVDALNRHHRHQDVFLFDETRVAGKERFDEERLVGNDHVINPRARNIDARQIALVVHQLVHLSDDDPVVERGGFHQRRRVFGACAGIQVAFTVRFKTGNQRHVRRKINVQAGVEFDVGMNGADFELAVLQQLRNTQALGSGEGEIEFAGDALFEDIEMLAATDAWHDHMQVMHDLRIDLGQ
ncbi:hypothetical protein D3C72_934460 [compost metagenome]